MLCKWSSRDLWEWHKFNCQYCWHVLSVFIISVYILFWYICNKECVLFVPTGWTVTVKKLHHSIRYLVATSELKVRGSVVKFVFCNKRAVWFCSVCLFLSIYLSIYVSVCPSIYLSSYLSVHLSFYLSCNDCEYVCTVIPRFSQGLGFETLCKKRKFTTIWLPTQSNVLEIF